MVRASIDPIAAWFVAAQELGEYIGIRFGRLPPGASEPEWIFLPHTTYDGIGGLAEILRQRGVKLDRLPQLKHPVPPSWRCLVRMLPRYLRPRRPVAWRPIDRGAEVLEGAGRREPEPPPAVGWHVFDEGRTAQIRRICRNSGITVNSFLLKHLTRAIRPFLEDQASVVPWMIPVNIRGKVDRGRDTDVHTSYVGVKVRSYETAHDVHRSIYAALGRGEHWANWQMYLFGRFTTAALRRRLVASGIGASQWNLGAFSNLGEWDPEKKINQADCQGAWFFAPPVLRIMNLGAGCATFQHRLSLTIQTHPELTRNPAVPRLWVQNWVKEIMIDLN